jgi:hypothetical protein
MYSTLPAVALLGLFKTSFMVEPLPAVAPVMLPDMVPTVQAKLLGVVEDKTMFGLVALQMASVPEFVTTGLGFTVTVIVNGEPPQAPAAEVGVTIYCTLPAAEPLGFVNTWLIVFPEPALAPVIPPFIAPTVHVKELDALEVSAMFGLVALQIATAAGLVTAGVGLTVTVIVKGALAQFPVIDVAVTMYSTVPAVELPGLVKTWLIVAPAPAVAPVMPPVTVPIVQVKELEALAKRLMFGLVPLQIDIVAGLATTGVGLTVTVIAVGEPVQLPAVEVGTTRYCTEPAELLLGLVNVWLIVGPDPAEAPVILPLIVPIVHVNVEAALAVRATFGLVLLQIDTLAGLVTAGRGFTVNVAVNGAPTHPPEVEVGVMIYSTVPAVALPGLVSVWLIAPPDPAVAPVIPPVMFPMVQANVLGAVEVSVTFCAAPLHIV